MLQSIPIQEISTLAIWIPLIMAGMRWKTGGRKIRLFFVFLLVGAIVDGFGWLAFGILKSNVLGDFHAFFFLPTFGLRLYFSFGWFLSFSGHQ
jgi:hypothetical protein